jgi:7-cyano-7-deazaguanine synthase in queuosine biosynthesis
MSVKTTVFIAALLILVGYAFGRYGQPARVETKVVTVIQKVEVTHHDTTTTETDSPDGTKTITTVDKSVDSTTTNSSTKSDTVVDGRNQWVASVKFAPQNPQIGYFYGAEVQRRILGPILAGAFVNTDRRVGLSVSLEF